MIGQREITPDREHVHASPPQKVTRRRSLTCWAVEEERKEHDLVRAPEQMHSDDRCVDRRRRHEGSEHLTEGERDTVDARRKSTPPAAVEVRLYAGSARSFVCWLRRRAACR